MARMLEDNDYITELVGWIFIPFQLDGSIAQYAIGVCNHVILRFVNKASK